MDNPKKPQTSEDEAAPAPAPPAPSLQARSPFRPLSSRRRQHQIPEPVLVLERPDTSRVFDASPTTIAATLAKAGASPAHPVRLAWGGDNAEADGTRPSDDGGAPDPS